MMIAGVRLMSGRASLSAPVPFVPPRRSLRGRGAEHVVEHVPDEQVSDVHVVLADAVLVADVHEEAEVLFAVGQRLLERHLVRLWSGGVVDEEVEREGVMCVRMILVVIGYSTSKLYALS